MEPSFPSQVPSPAAQAASPVASPDAAEGTSAGAVPSSASSSPASLVREFHRAFGLDDPSIPTEVSAGLAAHRGELLAEEAAEVAEVSVEGPLDRLAHELADVVYVAYGTALVHGIDLDAVIAEIHRANMTKIGPDGHVARRADGKVLKGEHYRAPDVAEVLRRQGWNASEA
ncbi:MazG nucleotide pyrophosphohydrolase domain-containing protein [Streptomyces sp. NPDC005227]|uniref:MazG nucleotide pyrophosphohydrolase domain-containing protein n=1 Tax=unclassified Streptomyces TaxID=2593676 RepID=UPI0036D0683B